MSVRVCVFVRRGKLVVCSVVWRSAILSVVVDVVVE